MTEDPNPWTPDDDSWFQGKGWLDRKIMLPSYINSAGAEFIAQSFIIIMASAASFAARSASWPTNAVGK